MIEKALIFLDDLDAAEAEQPRAFIKVGGLSLLERQLRQLSRAGIARVRIISQKFPELLFERIEAISQGLEVEVLDGNFVDGSLFEMDEVFLLLEEGVLVDQRLIDALAAGGEVSALALFPLKTVRFGASEGLLIETTEGPRLFASAARVTGRAMIEAMEHAAFSSLPLKTLLEIGVPSEPWEIVETAALGGFDPAVRGIREIFWRPVASKRQASRAAEVLLMETGRGTSDWVERYVMPLFEQLLVLRIAPLRPPRVLVETVVLALAFLVFMLFLGGRPGLGLAAAMVMGVLFAGLRRLRLYLLWRRAGIMERAAIERLSEYGWYLALAAGMPATALGWSAWGFAFLLVFSAWARELQIDHTSQRLGGEAWRSGSAASMLNLLGSGRNTTLWMLAPFALTGKWLLGLVVVALFSAVCFFFWQHLSFKALAEAVSGDEEEGEDEPEEAEDEGEDEDEVGEGEDTDEGEAAGQRPDVDDDAAEDDWE